MVRTIARYGMMAIDGRSGVVQLADHYAIALAAGVYDDAYRLEGNGVTDLGPVPGLVDGDAPAIAQQWIQIAAPIAAISMPTQKQYLSAQCHGRGVESL
jgi:hypothetical protein